jgi:site-specific recombinase XerD
MDLRADAALRVTVHAGKGMKTTRMPLPRRGRDALARLIRESRPPGDGFLFPDRGGEGHLTSKAAALPVERLRIRADMAESVSHHQRRHTFAHRLVTRGILPERVAERLGHSSLNTTRIHGGAHPPRNWPPMGRGRGTDALLRLKAVRFH